MILFVSEDCKRSDSIHSNESEFSLVYPRVDLRRFFTLARVEERPFTLIVSNGNGKENSY